MAKEPKAEVEDDYDYEASRRNASREAEPEVTPPNAASIAVSAQLAGEGAQIGHQIDWTNADLRDLQLSSVMVDAQGRLWAVEVNTLIMVGRVSK